MPQKDPSEPTPVKSGRSGFTFRQLWTTLWAYRIGIGLLVGVAVSVTYLASRMVPKTYEGTATVLVAFQANDPRAEQAFSEKVAQTFIGGQMEAIRGRKVLTRAVEKLDLANDAGFMAAYAGEDRPEARREWATVQLGKRISVALGEGRFIHVSADDGDGARAADLANAVAESFLEDQQIQSIGPASERLAQFDEGIAALRGRVEDAQARVSAYAAAHGDAKVAAGHEDSARLMELDRRLFEAQARRQQAELRLRGLGQDDASMPGAQMIHSLQSQLEQKQAALRKLKPLLGDQDPQYRSFKAEIAETRAKLFRVVVAYQQGLHDDAEAARSIELSLQRERQQLRGKALNAPFTDGEGAGLMRELDTAVQAYQSALDNTDAGRLGSDAPNSRVSIVTRAMPALTPIRPLVERNVLLALWISLMAGVVLALVRELANRRIRCTEDFERNLGIPVLAELGAGGA